MTFVRCFIVVLVLPVLVAGLFSAAPFASAAEAVCDCYCETEAGATHYPAEASAKITKSECQAACPTTYPGYRMAVCATASDQLPSQNVSCFTAPQCKQQNGEFDTKFQPPECMTGSRYCYPDKSKAAKVTLSTSIAGLTVTGDLGEYISKVYQWMLGAATTIAIVLMMVSGLRWSLGGFSAEQVKKAKTTIRNSMVGLVLLLGSYLILFTVNPQLLKLQVPSFPMIRQVALVGAGTSCGYLTGDSGLSGRRTEYDSDLKMDVYVYGDAEGYPGSPHNKDAPAPKGGKPYKLIEPTKGEECGSVAKVVKDWEGNGLAEGTTCTWDTCPIGSGEKCIVKQTGSTCFGCGDVVDGNDVIEPNRTNCPQFTPPPQKGASLYQQCSWTKSTVGTSAIGTGLGTSCVLLTIDCNQITSCEDYGSKGTVANRLGSTTLSKMYFAGPTPADLLSQAIDFVFNPALDAIPGRSGYIDMGDLSLTTVCADDPCVKAPAGKRCAVEKSLLWPFVNVCNTVNISDDEKGKGVNE